MEKKLNVVLAGLGFGSAFVPIYANHPDVAQVGVYDPDKDLARRVAQAHPVDRVYDSFEAVLSDPTVDAVHLISPIPCHEEQSLAVLHAGKHCACTVPMALTLEGLRRIIHAVRESGRKYMMMETSVYTSRFLYAREMARTGQLGHIQFLRGAHYQDMERWPDYWMGLPPMFYGTHAIAPLVMLAGSPIEKVHCFGSGVLREELRARYGNPYPLESALFAFENGLKAEVTRSLFQTARGYTESFAVYGDRRSFEWEQVEGESPVVFEMDTDDRSPGRGLPVSTRRVNPRNPYETLPESIRRFTVRSGEYDETNPQLSLTKDASGGHGGSHPHLVNEFIRSILLDLRPAVDAPTAANITAAGICAHQSAMEGGAEVRIPDFIREIQD